MNTRIRSGHSIVRAAAAALALLACGLGAAACTVEGSTVTGLSVIRGLPIPPDGVWRDLEQLAARDDGARHFAARFSRRFLLSIVDPSGVSAAPPIRYEIDPQRYDRQLQELDARLEALGRKTASFADDGHRRLRGMVLEGVFITGPALESLSYRDARLLPRGPNTAVLPLFYWKGRAGDGEERSYSVFFVQEHEHWKIDGFSDNFPLFSDGDEAAGIR